MKNLKSEKARARLQAKAVREGIDTSGVSAELINHFPAARFRGAVMSGFWPLPGEIDILPLLSALHKMGTTLALPCTPRAGKPLVFRAWQPGDVMKSGSFGTKEPKPTAATLRPDVVLLPLLAFTPTGDRLGYGGGFYDRSLAELGEIKNIFACGVAYAEQEAVSLPVGEYDKRLDGILTEKYFKDF